MGKQIFDCQGRLKELKGDGFEASVGYFAFFFWGGERDVHIHGDRKVVGDVVVET